MSNTNTSPGGNGWPEWSRHVLAELDRLDTAILALSAKVDGIRDTDMRELRVSLAVLQTRASLWAGAIGLVGGALAALLTLATRMIR